MKKKIMVGTLLLMIFIGFTTGCGKQESDEKTNINKKEEEVRLPVAIFDEITMIKVRLELNCNSNGQPLELVETGIGKNDYDNYVISYNTGDKNEILSFVYNDNNNLQSFTITFSDRTNDYSKFLNIIEYLLQVKELNIPVDEVNEVYSIINNNTESFWTEVVGGRTYTYFDKRNREDVEDMQIFSVDYNY